MIVLTKRLFKLMINDYFNIGKMKVNFIVKTPERILLFISKHSVENNLIFFKTVVIFKR